MRFIIYSDAIDNGIDGDSTTLSKRVDRYNIKSFEEVVVIVKNEFLDYLIKCSLSNYKKIRPVVASATTEHIELCCSWDEEIYHCPGVENINYVVCYDGKLLA